MKRGFYGGVTSLEAGAGCKVVMLGAAWGPLCAPSCHLPSTLSSRVGTCCAHIPQAFAKKLEIWVFNGKSLNR